VHRKWTARDCSKYSNSLTYGGRNWHMFSVVEFGCSSFGGWHSFTCPYHQANYSVGDSSRCWALLTKSCVSKCSHLLVITWMLWTFRQEIWVESWWLIFLSMVLCIGCQGALLWTLFVVYRLASVTFLCIGLFGVLLWYFEYRHLVLGHNNWVQVRRSYRTSVYPLKPI